MTLGNTYPPARTRIRLLLPAFLSLALLVQVEALGGQVVQGRVLDTETTGPVKNGRVALLDSIGSVVARAGTDDEGAFRLNAPGPGVYSLLATGLGYSSAPSLRFSVSENGPTSVDIYLRPEPLEMEPITVETRRQWVRSTLENQGFYTRQKQGIGSFLTPEMISRIPAVYVGDLLRHAPFVYPTGSPFQSTVYVTRAGRSCIPGIYVDGNKTAASTSPEDWVNADEIAAVEVYRGSAQIPAQWASFETCGVILIWTNRNVGGRR